MNVRIGKSFESKKKKQFSLQNHIWILSDQDFERRNVLDIFTLYWSTKVLNDVFTGWFFEKFLGRDHRYYIKMKSTFGLNISSMMFEKPLRKWQLLKKLTIRNLKTWFYRRKTYYFAFCAANRLSSSSFVSSTLRDSPPLVNPFQMQYPFKAHGSLSADVLW